MVDEVVGIYLKFPLRKLNETVKQEGGGGGGGRGVYVWRKVSG